MADPIVSATAAEWNYQPNSFLVSYCNGQNLDPAQYYVDSRKDSEYAPLMLDIHARTP